MKLKLYLDSDGLVADWVAKMIELIQHPEIVCQETLNKHPERSQYIQAVYKTNPEVFGELDIIPLGKKLIETLQALNISFKILTAVGPDHHCFDTVKRTKIMWFKQHFNLSEEHIICVPNSSDKTKYAYSNAILVDDYEKNIQEWNECGGKGLLFKEDEQTYLELIEQIKRLFNYYEGDKYCRFFGRQIVSPFYKTSTRED